MPRDPVLASLVQAAVPDLEQLLLDTMQLLYAVKSDWQGMGVWSEFDQGVVDRIESANHMLAVCTGNVPRAYRYTEADQAQAVQVENVIRRIRARLTESLVMPIINCPSCNRPTNTALCPGWWEKSRQAKCTARLDTSVTPPRYEKGCGYDTANEFDQHFANSVIQHTG